MGEGSIDDRGDSNIKRIEEEEAVDAMRPTLSDLLGRDNDLVEADVRRGSGSTLSKFRCSIPVRAMGRQKIGS